MYLRYSKGGKCIFLFFARIHVRVFFNFSNISVFAFEKKGETFAVLLCKIR